MTPDRLPVRGRRIGIITYDYDPPIGGLGVLVRTYVQELKKMYPADTFTVVSPSASADESGSPLSRTRFRKAGGCPLFSLALLFSLPAIIRKHNFDLIHVHSGSGGVFVLRKPPCKLVVSAHHTYRQEADIVFARSPKKIWKLFMALLEARTYHVADAVACVSEDTAQEIIKEYAVPAGRVCVIENPVNVVGADSFHGLPKDPNTVLFVGRLELRKGVLLLLKAFQMLKKEIPNVQLRLVGFNLLGPRLQATIRSRGLTDCVTMLGYVHDPYRFRETATATVLVVPSTLEGFGLVAAEAMILGTCVIASDAPGLRSVVTSGRNGLTFPVGNARACADAMKRILTDTTLRENLVREALAEAPLRFSVEKRTRDLGNVYDRVLGK